MIICDFKLAGTEDHNFTITIPFKPVCEIVSFLHIFIFTDVNSLEIISKTRQASGAI